MFLDRKVFEHSVQTLLDGSQEQFQQHLATTVGRSSELIFGYPCEAKLLATFDRTALASNEKNKIVRFAFKKERTGEITILSEASSRQDVTPKQDARKYVKGQARILVDLILTGRISEGVQTGAVLTGLLEGRPEVLSPDIVLDRLQSRLRESRPWFGVWASDMENSEDNVQFFEDVVELDDEEPSLQTLAVVEDVLSTLIGKYKSLLRENVKVVDVHAKFLEDCKNGTDESKRVFVNSTLDYLADLRELCDRIQESMEQVYDVDDFGRLFDMLAKAYGKYQSAGVYLQGFLSTVSTKV